MDNATLDRLHEIESRCQVLDPGPWQWRQCYEIGNRIHWALESPQSAAERMVASYLLVLNHSWPKTLGEPVEENPYLQFIAHSRDDIEWLCQQLRRQPHPYVQRDDANEAVKRLAGLVGKAGVDDLILLVQYANGLEQQTGTWVPADAIRQIVDALRCILIDDGLLAEPYPQAQHIEDCIAAVDAWLDRQPQPVDQEDNNG